VTSLVQGARGLVRRDRPSVGDRLEALEAAAAAGRGRLPEGTVDRADAVVVRGRGRLALSGDHTVVALAGATGSGKSSLLNALAGEELSKVGFRRPTSSFTTGVVFGEDDGAALLEWLDIRRRHQVAGPAELDGLVLLDLPDHDSTEVAHHVEVERVVELVDVLVWVLDPQKYADAALHERYLRRLAGHAEVMVAVLNHVDEVVPSQRDGLLRDVAQRLEEDGLVGVPVIATSARHGDGLPELQKLLAAKVRGKKATAARLAADVTAVAGELQEANGAVDPGKLRRANREALVESFAEAAAVPTVVRAVERSVARRGGQHTGWPFVSWLGRLRPDPLRRLHLDVGSSGKELTGLGRASVPPPTPVQRARVDAAVREVADQVGSQLAPPWARAVRDASVSRLGDIDDALDRAVVATDLGTSRTPLWWRFARALQLLLALAVLVGAGWLVVLAVMGYLQLPEPSTSSRFGLPLPTLLLVAGLAGGLALAIVGRVVNGWVARSRARAARRRLTAALSEVADELVVAPIDAELAAYAEVRRHLATAVSR
jgi:GTP-binding protein EngB required for normal cell division